LEREFSGALLRPHAPMLKFMEQTPEKLKDITTAAYDAGLALGHGKEIESDILERVSQPLVPMENYVRKE